MFRKRPLFGPDGGPHHQDLIDTIRYEAPKHVAGWRAFDDFLVVADRNLMIRLFRQAGLKGSKIADVVFVGPHGLVVVEVGRLLVDKWHGMCPVIHVGFSHKVSIINGRGDPFEATLKGSIEKAIYSTDLDGRLDLDPP